MVAWLGRRAAGSRSYLLYYLTRRPRPRFWAGGSLRAVSVAESAPKYHRGSGLLYELLESMFMVAIAVVSVSWMGRAPASWLILILTALWLAIRHRAARTTPPGPNFRVGSGVSSAGWRRLIQGLRSCPSDA
jgi:hypothetical protein